MPLLIEPQDQDFVIAAAGQRLAIGLRNPPGPHDVKILRVCIDATLEPWLELPDPSAYPCIIGSDKKTTLELVAKSLLPQPVFGEVALHVLEAGITAVRPLRLSLITEREFTGIFAVDLGSSRLAAAYIDLTQGSDEPHLIEFDTDAALSTTFVADFAGWPQPPRLRGPEGVLRRADNPLLENLFMRPRRALRHSERRRVLLPSGNSWVEEADGISWLLLDLLRRVARRPRLGRPRQLTIPLPASLTPLQVAACRLRTDQHDELKSIRYGLGPVGSMTWLDEASAVALYWIWEHAYELKRASSQQPDQERNLRLLVIDSGAECIELALLDLVLRTGGGSGLEATPRLLARDGCTWMAGDRVTAQIFRRIKQQAAAALAAAPPATNSDEAVEAVLPTRFRGQHGHDFSLRLRNFHTLWQAAEELKHSLVREDSQVTTTLTGLELVSGPVRHPVTVDLAGTELAHELEEQAGRCLRRIQNVLARNDLGEHFAVDHLILTGAASQLLLFRRLVIEPLCQGLQPPGTATPQPLVDLASRSKEVVALGAALATYYKDCAPDTRQAGAVTRLTFTFDQFHRRLPYHVAYMASNELLPAFSAGQEFPEQDGRLTPLRHTIAWQNVVMLFRFAGRQFDSTVGEFLGEFRLPERQPDQMPRPELLLYPDHHIEVQCQGHPYELKDQPGSQVGDDPFSGALL